jgi:hypothetical protein
MELEIGKQACLVQELSGLQVRESLAQGVLGELGDALEQSVEHVLADGRGGLQELLVVGRQAVDAGGDDGLDRGGDAEPLDATLQAIGSALAGQSPRLRQHPHALLEEKGVPLGAGDQPISAR